MILPAVVVGLCASAVVIGCGGSSPKATTQAVSFRASAGTNHQPLRPSDSQTILNLGELTIRASCNRSESGQTLLSVGAETGVNHAVVSSRYTEAGTPPTPYVFVLDDFNKSYGPWDFLGEIRKAAGTLTYSRPDGGQVSMSFTMALGGSRADCFFGGVATLAPPNNG